MKQGSTLFLKFAILILGAAVLAACIFILPEWITMEKAKDYKPIVLGMYLPVIPYMIALFQSLKLLGNIEANKVFSQSSVKSFNVIKYCGFFISILYTAGMPYIYYVAKKGDSPGVILIGLMIIFASFVIGAAAALFKKLLQNAIEIKTENELIV